MKDLPGLSPDEQREIAKILSPVVRFIDHPSLHMPNARLTLFRDKIDMRDAELLWQNMLAKGIIQTPDKTILLSQAQEQTLFLQFNYAKMVVRGLQLAKYRTTQESRDLLLWWQIHQKVKSDLIVANIGMVFLVLKQLHLTKHNDISEYIQLGNIAVLRAVEGFDISRGFKFSTYAYRAIQHGIFRSMGNNTNTRSITDLEYQLQDQAITQQVITAETIVDISLILGQNLAGLTPMEKEVIFQRFGLNGAKVTGSEALEHLMRAPTKRHTGANACVKTLDQVGAIFGLGRERIRQIEDAAFEKIKVALGQLNKETYETANS